MPPRRPRRPPLHPGPAAVARCRPSLRLPGVCLVQLRAPRGSARHAERAARRGSAPPAATRGRNGWKYRGRRRANCLARRPHNKARTGSGQLVLPARAFAVEALFAIAQAEEMFLSVACVYRWAQGLRPGGFGSSEGPPNHTSLCQEMNKGRLLRACAELRNGPTVLNPAGLFARVTPCLSHARVSHLRAPCQGLSRVCVASPASA